MIAFLFSFFWFIKTFFKFTDFTIHWMWAIYNNLFQHLKNWYSEAEYELMWKNDLQIIIKNAQNKFDKYYKWTKHVRKKFYAITAVLDSYL